MSSSQNTTLVPNVGHSCLATGNLLGGFGRVLKESAEIPQPLPYGHSRLDDMDKDEWMDWFSSLPEKERVEKRADILIKGLRSGYTLQGMSELYGITRERVRQIVKEKGVITSALRKEQKAQAERHNQRVVAGIHRVSVKYPELTIQELAEALDTEEGTVRKALGPRLPVHDSESHAASPRGMSHEELLDAMVEWGAQTSNLTGDDYTTWASQRGIPGKQTIAIRFGSWNEAMELAGLGEFIGDRGGTRPQIIDEELWATVLEFFRTERPSYSFQSYDEFVRAQDLASGPTLRNRLGTWTEVRRVVRQLLRYAANPDGNWDLGDRVLSLSLEDAPRNFVTKDRSREAVIKASARIVGPCTVAAYDTVRDRDDPSGAVVTSRYGSWIDALLDAGLEERMSAKARRKWERRDQNEERCPNNRETQI